MRRRDDKFPDNGFEAWGGYMQAKIAKLEEQYTSKLGKEEQESSIFIGVSIYVNGFTSPSADELKILMSRHGGVYHTYQRSEDFIIASNLPDTKVKNMSLARVVKPEWIVDSIVAGRLLNYRDYLLYKNSRLQRQLNFIKSNVNDTSAIKSCTTTLKNLKKENQLEFQNIDIPMKVDQNNYRPPGVSDNTEIKTTCLLDTQLLKNKVTNASADDLTILKPPTLHQTTKTAADPNFISEFYNNSRLHHISQLGACFKQYINDLRENSNFEFPSRLELHEKITSLNLINKFSQLQFEKGKIIMHIDMDCFFVSVGLRNRPELRGKPVAVTHSKGGQGRPKRPGVDRNSEFQLYKQKQAKKISKAVGIAEDELEFESRVDNITDEDDKYGSMSEIASCSYEARAKGIKNGMFMGAALKLCPDLQTIPYDFEGYKEVAYTLYNTIAQYTLDIEAVSCDEMYVECTELIKEMNISVQEFASLLRIEIRSKTGCPCSTGFGGNRLQARLATRKAKPDGQFFLTTDLVEDFMYGIQLKDLPGVGRQIAHKLESLGHSSCGSLQNLTLASLKTHLGTKTGAQLFDQCRGRDPNPLSYHTVRKSVSAEVNYGIRFENKEQCFEFLKQLSAEVHSRMQQFKVLGKCITLKLMVRAEDAPIETAKFLGHGFCNVINKSVSLNNAINDIETITKEVISLCKKQNIDPKEMRGIGIQVTKLEQTNIKPVIGTINKFLSKDVKIEIASKLPNEIARSHTKVQDVVKTEINETRPITPKKGSKQIVIKSPIISQAKSPGKRRGRPPKNTRLQQSSKNLMSKFLQGQSMRDTPFKDPMIRDAKTITEPSIGIKIEQEKPGLLGLSWEKVRELLRAWLESEQAPLPCDVELIAAYMKDQVARRDLEKLSILVNFLRRRTFELNNTDWNRVCDQIVEQVQCAMLSVYGKKIWLNDFF